MTPKRCCLYRRTGGSPVAMDSRDEAGRLYVLTTAASVRPAVEPGLLPGRCGTGLWTAPRIRNPKPNGKMPSSTAAKMGAATTVRRKDT